MRRLVVRFVRVPFATSRAAPCLRGLSTDAKDADVVPGNTEQTEEVAGEGGLGFDLDLEGDQTVPGGGVAPAAPAAPKPRKKKTLRGPRFGGKVQAVQEEEEYADVMSIKNPPILTVEHYQMFQELRVANASRAMAEQGLSEKEIEGVFGNNDAQPPAEVKTTGADELFEEASDDEGPVRGETEEEAQAGLGRAEELADLDRDYPWVSPIRQGRRGGECIFCKPDLSTHQALKLAYSNVELLHRFINPRGMITSRTQNGNCARHQRKVSRAIKQAREIGLLNPDSNWRVPLEFVTGEDAAAWQRFPDDVNATDSDSSAAKVPV